MKPKITVAQVMMLALMEPNLLRLVEMVKKE